MEVSRPSRGEIVAAVGALILLFALVLPWYEVGEGKIAPLPLTEGTVPESFGAWSHGGTLATLANLVIFAAGLFGLAVAALAAVGARLDGSGRLLAVLSALALAMVVLRMIFKPEEIELGTTAVPFEFDAGLEIGIFVTLAGAILLLAGALMRIVQPESRTVRPPPHSSRS